MANLRKPRSQAVPSHIVFFDTETSQSKIGDSKVRHTLKLGWANYCRYTPGDGFSEGRWHEFTEPVEFWRWLKTLAFPKTRIYLFAHNAQFDVLVNRGFDVAITEGFGLEAAVIENPPFILTYKYKSTEYRIISSTNIFQAKLAKLGKLVGMEKGDWAESAGDDATLREYCKQDVRVLKKVMERWFEFIVNHGYGAIAPTLASQSFVAYRTKFLKHRVLIDTNDDALRVARASYRGGRTEAFFIGKIPTTVTVLDVMSMYPYIMRENVYPARLNRYLSEPRLDDFRRLRGKFLVCADCTIEAKQPAIAVYRDQKLIFPIGRYRVSLCSPEVDWIEETGKLVKVHSAAFYEPEPLFTGFVNEFTKLRQRYIREKNDIYAQACKLIQNSLYGKFAQNGVVWSEYGRDYTYDLKQWTDYNVETGIETDFRQVADLIQYKERESESKYSHPAIAAHVTAYARMYLWSLICLAGKENVYYTDTDSLFVNATGKSRLIERTRDNELGYLGLKGEFSDVVIRGLKDYSLNELVRIKGVRQNATQVAPNQFRQEMWWGASRHIGHQDYGGPIVEYVTKHLSRAYTKGQIRRDGRVTPFRLRE